MLLGILTGFMQLSIYDGLAVSAGKSRDLLIANPKATRLLVPAGGHAFVIAAGFTAWHGLQL
jgi:threonine/homoserine/homoserine lactone efflux protein